MLSLLRGLVTKDNIRAMCVFIAAGCVAIQGLEMSAQSHLVTLFLAGACAGLNAHWAKPTEIAP